MTEPSGVLIVNKHTGVTSHDIVYKIRRLYNTKRVGHTGTLDPDASGVLVVLVGRAAKAAEYLALDEKKYTATLRLGITTDTEDVSGNVLTRTDKIPNRDEVISATRQFVGDLLQVPPMYSALKKDGQKLYDLARKGITVERDARPIKIFSLECSPLENETDYKLKVHCSSGTYIRTLCADIGASLGCGGVMASLCRTDVGGFSITNALSISELEEMSEVSRLSALIPTESLFSSLPEVRLGEFYERLSRNGCEIYQKKIHTSFPVEARVRLCSQNGDFYAIGEVRDYESGSAIKAIKIFDIK